MGQKWTGPDGWTIERKILNRRELLHVRRGAYHEADCYTWHELLAVLARNKLSFDEFTEETAREE